MRGECDKLENNRKLVLSKARTAHRRLLEGSCLAPPNTGAGPKNVLKTNK